MDGTTISQSSSSTLRNRTCTRCLPLPCTQVVCPPLLLMIQTILLSPHPNYADSYQGSTLHVNPSTTRSSSTPPTDPSNKLKRSVSQVTLPPDTLVISDSVPMGSTFPVVQAVVMSYSGIGNLARLSSVYVRIRRWSSIMSGCLTSM